MADLFSVKKKQRGKVNEAVSKRKKSKSYASSKKKLQNLEAEEVFGINSRPDIINQPQAMKRARYETDLPP